MDHIQTIQKPVKHLSYAGLKHCVGSGDLYLFAGDVAKFIYGRLRKTEYLIFKYLTEL